MVPTDVFHPDEECRFKVPLDHGFASISDLPIADQLIRVDVDCKKGYVGIVLLIGLFAFAGKSKYG